MRFATRLSLIRPCESGAVAVEFALVAMTAISIFLGIIEFGRALYMRNELSFAADLAARKILTNPTIADSDLENTIRSAITFGGSEPLRVTFGTEAVDGLPFRTLSVRQPLTLMIPNLFQTGIMLTVNRRVPLL